MKLRRSTVVAVVIVVIIAAIGIYYLIPPTTSTLRVRVIQRDGTPISALKVNLWEASKSPITPPDFSRTTDEDGYAVFEVSPGDYLVGFDPQEFPAQYVYPSEVQVTVQASGETDKAIKLFTEQQLGKGILKVVVLGPEGKPEANLQVGLWTHGTPPGEPDLGYKVTDSTGTVVFEVDLGDYMIGFNHDAFPAGYVFQPRMSVSVGQEGAEMVIQLEPLV